MTNGEVTRRALDAAAKAGAQAAVEHQHMLSEYLAQHVKEAVVTEFVRVLQEHELIEAFHATERYDEEPEAADAALTTEDA